MASESGPLWPTGLRPMSTHPPVTIVTPTYNRRKFIPYLIECIKAQTYPLDRMEWLVFDDGSDKILDLLTPYLKTLNIRYFTSDTKLNIGVKRNRLHDEARGEVIVVMDDDDYYSEDRVSHAVRTLVSRKVELVGSSRNHLFFTDDQSIWECGPYGPTHSTFGTMAFQKSLTRTHRCDETVTFAEEVSFTDHYKVPMAQLDPMKVMLVMCHSENTYNKNKLRETPSPFMKKTGMKLRTFIKSAALRAFYSSA